MRMALWAWRRATSVVYASCVCECVCGMCVAVLLCACHVLLVFHSHTHTYTHMNIYLYKSIFFIVFPFDFGLFFCWFLFPPGRDILNKKVEDEQQVINKKRKFYVALTFAVAGIASHKQKHMCNKIYAHKQTKRQHTTYNTATTTIGSGNNDHRDNEKRVKYFIKQPESMQRFLFRCLFHIFSLLTEKKKNNYMIIRALWRRIQNAYKYAEQLRHSSPAS